MAQETSNGKVKLGKKRLYTLIASIVLVIVIVAFAAYYWESGTTIAKITQFSKRLGGQIPEQVLYVFSVKVENQGTNNINGLTLGIRILGDGIQIVGENYTDWSLPRGQEFTNNDWGIWVNITDIGSKTITFAATLELDNKTIDEVTLTS
jgi:divalent metal cation (Fe/Co/Zn/Cd) transporter